MVTIEEEKIVRWAVDKKEDWGREKEIIITWPKCLSHLFFFSFLT